MSDSIRLTAYSHGGGCACKLSIQELDEILAYLPPTPLDPRVLVGLDRPDDAGVVRLTDEIALVQTVDFFTPIVDDPYSWGRIAAVNALSDVYAMGGVPLSALNLVAWPRSLDLALLGRVLEGGRSACEEAGVAVVGGHSVDDPEPKFGLAVTGTVHPDRFVTKVGGSPGDELVLTKPLGTGIVTHAIKHGDPSPEHVEAAVSVMGELNRAAAEAMLEVGVSAATDVTGFGLLGHLSQMLEGRLDAELALADVPLLPGVLGMVADGIFPGGSERNRTAIAPFVDTSVTENETAVLFDAQTSGGLLIAVPATRRDELLEALASRGARGSTIGRLTSGKGRIKVTDT